MIRENKKVCHPCLEGQDFSERRLCAPLNEDLFLGCGPKDPREGALAVAFSHGGFFRKDDNTRISLRFLQIAAIFLFIEITFIHSYGYATSTFFEKHAEGWHWYETRDQCSDISDQKEERKDLSLTPTQQIENQRKELETKLHAAIVAPTPENLTTYLLAQRALMNQSQRFSEAWKKLLMTTPSLDETLTYPTDQNARSLYYEKRHQAIKTRIQDLAKNYGLFYFFKGKCAYCHGFAPLVKRFAEKYGWSVFAVSLDGGTVGEFPKAKPDNGIAAHLGITHVPALIALHPQTGHFIPLAYGMISESEIEMRVLALTAQEAGERR